MANLRKVGSGIFTVYKDKERKPLVKIAYELMSCLINRREIPYHYFTHLLYKNEKEDFFNYIGQKDIFNIKNNVLKPGGRTNPYLQNKLLFQEFLSEREIPLPKMIGHGSNNMFTVRNEKFSVDTEVDLEYMLRATMYEKDNFFIKPLG